jgi:hypothetical protein
MTKVEDMVLLHDVPRVADYVGSQFANGGGLFRQLISLLPNGSFYAITSGRAREGVSDLYAFKRGMAVNIPSDGPKKDAVDVAVTQMVAIARDGECFVVADARNSRPHDPSLQRVPFVVAIHDADVYFVGSTREGAGTLRSIIRCSSAAWYSAALLTSARPPSWAGGMPWADDDVLAMAHSTRAVLIGAYDDEGYILWAL